ncbi:NUDIX domain-containing protein [Streptomyces sp. NEAU-S77]|uniref:NUDIX domain-containing protein n=1 Tax=Streptomyces sp. NEAU-S77 TaxID=3411033 RepID=UPI003BA0B549
MSVRPGHDGEKGLPAQPEQQAAVPGTVVAVVLAWRGRIGLFKRGRHVGHDAGLWHCITGFLEDGNHVHAQALLKLFEATGISVAELVDFRPGPVLDLPDTRGGRWRAHTFRAETERKKLRLSWEYDACRWVRPRSVVRFDGQAAWLRAVLAAVGAVA